MYGKKFSDLAIGVGKNPIIIVGQNPGRQRNDDRTITGLAWNGNRSADLLIDCVKGLDNLLLTNICQYQYMDEERMYSGYVDLQQKINKLKPSLIICLGSIAYDEVETMDFDCKLVKLLHPSYICRFQKDKVAYKRKLRALCKKAVYS